MIVRTEYPAGVPCWIDLTPPDIPAAIDFYGGVFGWRFVNRAPAGAPFEYHVAQLDGLDVAAVGTPNPGTPDPLAWALYVAVTDADEALARVRAAGGKVLDTPPAVPGVGRSAACLDPAGAPFSVWESHGRAGLALVNAPNTWNFNELTTPDPEGAEAFYGAVFGWKVAGLDFGGGPMSMWVLPGYGDFLASRDPDLRRRHAEQPTPDDFSNAVAWLRPTAADAGTGAAWSTTFAVDDTDAVVRRAETLGATVTSPPTDIGVVRVADLVDPQGVPFTVSHYKPGTGD